MYSHTLPLENLFFLTGGRLYTGYLGGNNLCKLDGESVVTIIESSMHGCTVRKPYNLSVFLLVFLIQSYTISYSCKNFIISKERTEVNWT